MHLQWAVPKRSALSLALFECVPKSYFKRDGHETHMGFGGIRRASFHCSTLLRAAAVFFCIVAHHVQVSVKLKIEQNSEQIQTSSYFL
mmetsp:Transcript_69950/g.134984  ORF Transcript_69950/g.134984 Transcript_69950/m.134984 type:complete len:88 (-) Transcript_69950:498-761(-)